jgi:hypothetical protein
LRLKKHLIIESTINQSNQMATFWQIKLLPGLRENEKTRDEKDRGIPRILPTVTVDG